MSTMRSEIGFVNKVPVPRNNILSRVIMPKQGMGLRTEQLDSIL